MTTLPHVRSLAVLALAFLLGVLAPAGAQDASPKAEAAPKADNKTDAKDKRSALSPTPPKTPVERDAVLGDLYGLLAESEDEMAAKSVADNIERVWVHSGSPTVDLLFERAMLAVSQKDFDRALRFLNHVVEQAPDFTEGWNRRAFVHFQLNNVGLALGDLRRALALDPHHFKALDGLFQVLRDVGEKRAALEVLRRLADVHPYWVGAEQTIEELSREVEGQGI